MGPRVQFEIGQAASPASPASPLMRTEGTLDGLFKSIQFELNLFRSNLQLPEITYYHLLVPPYTLNAIMTTEFAQQEILDPSRYLRVLVKQVLS
eukprot:1157768-Pelagomonas_calceolata.AAC.5